MNLSIKGKLIGASIIILGLMSGLVVFLLDTQKHLEAQMTEMIHNNLTAIRMAEQIKYHVVLYDDLIFRYLVTNRKAFVGDAIESLEEAKMWIGKMKDHTQGETEQELLVNIGNETVRYRKGVKKLIELYRTSREAEQRNSERRGILKLFSTEEEPVPKQSLSKASEVGRSRLSRIFSQCEKLVDIYRAKMEMAQDQIRSEINHTRKMVIISGSIAFAAAVIVIIVLSLEILIPIGRLLAGIQKVSSGELDLEIPVNSSDEIGRLTRHFNSMTQKLKAKQDRLVIETITDPLTELHNLRHFHTCLENEITRAQRHRRPFCLLMVDIDYFKHFNDTNGHQMGNILLKELANILKSSVRADGVTARFGGEEFTLILPETDTAGGKIVAERLRASVEKSALPGSENQPGGKLTISIGGASFPKDGLAGSVLINKADQALYKAKNSGRNRTHWS